MNGRLTVLVASPDRDYLRLARAVLRTHEHLVYTTSVSHEALCRQVRLRRPDVVLIDVSFEADKRFRADLTAPHAIPVLRVVEGSDDAGSPGFGMIDKWAAPTELARAVGRAAEVSSATVSRRLRLVGH